VSPQSRQRRRVPRSVWTLGALVALYLALGWLFEHETQARGLLTPGGAPNLDVIAVGGVYLLVRMVVRFGLPFAVALGVVRSTAAVIVARARGRDQ
jgi:hypothetical protein